MLKKPPCLDCTERHQSCHSQCERYLTYVKEKDAQKKNIEKQKYDNDQFMSVITRKWRK